MKIVVAEVLSIVVSADACVRHDGGTAAGLVGAGARPVSTGTGAGIAVERVRATELMPNFMSNNFGFNSSYGIPKSSIHNAF